MERALEHYDVAIAGAGPAGSSAAIRLAVAGLRVLLVEQKRFPREKLCGEFISPECIPHFQELGVLSEIRLSGSSHYSETVFFARNGRHAAIRSSWFGTTGADAIGLSRAELDRLLIERARAVGVDVRDETRIIAVIREDDRVSGLTTKGQDGTTKPASARMLIDATGRGRSLSRFVEPREHKKPASSVAFKTHLRGALVPSGVCELYAFRGGYGGCNEVENGVHNCCFIVSSEEVRRIGSDPEHIWRETMLSNRRAAETMETAEAIYPWLAVPIESYGRKSLVPAEGIIAIGDAAAFIDPFTGSGMLLALESSKIAANVIIDNLAEAPDLADLSARYQQAYSAKFDRRLKVCSGLRYASSVPFAAEATIALLSSSDLLRRRVARLTRSSAEHAA